MKKVKKVKKWKSEKSGKREKSEKVKKVKKVWLGAEKSKKSTSVSKRTTVTNNYCDRNGP